MIFVDFGGQQLSVVVSALPHLLISGAETGAAKANGSEEERLDTP